MSRYIATRALRGANLIVNEFDALLQKALVELGPDKEIKFTNTAYYLPTILGYTGIEVSNIGGLKPVLDHCRTLLHSPPADRTWLPYLGETLDAGVATLLAEEGIMGIRFAYGLEPQKMPGLQLTGSSAPADGYLNGPIDDIQLRSWGIQLVDGRMPGFAAIIGCARTNQAAVEIVRQLQQRNILIFLSGNVNGRSVIHQLMEEGVEMGYDTYIVPFGLDTISTVYPMGFATRSALTFGGMKGGQAREILLYNKYRVFAFALALGEVDDLKYATAAGAITYGFPALADTVIPEIRPTGITQYEHVISMPWDDIEGADDAEKAARFVQKAIEVRGVKIKVTEVPIPVPYGSAFEGERVRKEEMRVEFGGKYSRAFEYLRMVDLDQIEDHKIEVIGPGFEEVKVGGAMDLGILVEVAGRKMQEDFEPVLERQIHYFINGASGIQHIGQRDIAWIRISKTAADKGFNLKHFGEILYARFHSDFGAIVDKVQVKIITDPALHAEWLEKARVAYDYRNKRLAEMTDEAVDEFYSCTLCLPAGEQIILADGSFMPVERLVDRVVEEQDLEVLSFNSHGLTIRPVGELFINPSPARLVKITLSNGNSLTLTANHKLLVDTPAGLEWVPAGEIKAGDYLVDGQPGLLAAPPSQTNLYIIDYLPDDYKVSDDSFILNYLKPAVLSHYGSYKTASEALAIPYQRLYSAMYEKEFPRQRLTLGEVKRIAAAAGLSWDEIKTQIHIFQAGCELKKVQLDEEVIYLAGLIASDGSVTWRGQEGQSGVYVHFTNTEPALITRFGEIVKTLFGQEPATYPFQPGVAVSGELKVVGKKPGQVSYVYNTLLGHLMAGLGIGRPDQKEKWTGEVISTMPPTLVAAFLRGLFDGDGHVAGNRAFISTGTYREAQHLHLLFKKLGIASYISQTARGYQVGTRANQDLARFREQIGSEHPAKRARLEKIGLRSDPQHTVRTDVVPLVCGRYLQALLDEYKGQLPITQLPVDYKTIKAWTGGRCRASKAKLSTLLEGLTPVVPASHPIYQDLLAWSRSNVRFEQVKQVERIASTNGKVYNFSVEETHNYLANGVVVKNCQSFAPNHVCVVSPERLGLCGAYNWLDCKASYQINPTGPNQPIPKGRAIDPWRGVFENVNAFVQQASHGSVESVTMYSIMETPMTSCGCFECIMMILPLCNGFMVVSREDPSMTPAGMTFSTLAGMAGGGLQTPGVMGHGKYFIVSKKFIRADGGLKRIVWMSSFLKETMAEELREAAIREGDPDLIDKIADERVATTEEEVLAYLEQTGHPALTMEPLM